MSNRASIPWPCRQPGTWTKVWPERVGFRDCTLYRSDSRPDYLCLHLVTQGTVRFSTSRGVDVVLKTGDLFTMWPGVSWRLVAEPPCKPQEARVDWIRLKGTLAPDLVRLIGIPPEHPYTHAANPSHVRHILRRLLRLAQEYPPRADLLAVALIYSLAAACVGAQPMREHGRPLAERIREYIEEHIGSGMNVKDVARAFDMSRSSLFLAFRETFGMSPIAVLSEIRLRYARMLLRTTRLSIKELSKACGFHSPAYFARRFQKEVGMSASAYRRMQLKPEGRDTLSLS